MEVNVSFHGYYVSSSILVIYRSDQTLLFVVEEPRPYIGFEPISSADAVSRCSPVELLRDIADGEGL